MNKPVIALPADAEGSREGATVNRASRPSPLGCPNLRAMAVWVVFLQTIMSASPGEPPPPGRDEGQARPVQTAQNSRAWPRGHEPPGYQLFARQVSLPAIVVVDENTLAFGEGVKVNMRSLGPMSIREKKALAGQFEVPVEVLDKALRRASTKTQSNAAQWAQELRTLVIDYKYLQDRWNRYRPPGGQEKLKANALEALQAGEIEKAWEMYDALPRPQPPGGLRVVNR